MRFGRHTAGWPKGLCCGCFDVCCTHKVRTLRPPLTAPRHPCPFPHPSSPAAAADQSDPSTPGGSLKRLPIFERLIPEAGGRCSYDLADGGEPERRSRCSQDSFAACL